MVLPVTSLPATILFHQWDWRLDPNDTNVNWIGCYQKENVGQWMRESKYQWSTRNLKVNAILSLFLYYIYSVCPIYGNFDRRCCDAHAHTSGCVPQHHGSCCKRPHSPKHIYPLHMEDVRRRRILTLFGVVLTFSPPRNDRTIIVNPFDPPAILSSCNQSDSDVLWEWTSIFVAFPWEW